MYDGHSTCTMAIVHAAHTPFLRNSIWTDSRTDGQVTVFLLLFFDSGQQDLDPPPPLAGNENLFCFVFAVSFCLPEKPLPPPSPPPRKKELSKNISVFIKFNVFFWSWDHWGACRPPNLPAFSRGLPPPDPRDLLALSLICFCCKTVLFGRVVPLKPCSID